MHIFPALTGKLRRDVNNDLYKEVLRDWDFPCIHRTVDSESGCLEANASEWFIVWHFIVMQTVVRIK